MLQKSGMTSKFSSIDEAPEPTTCGCCNSTKLLIFVVLVLYAVCQTQILVNRPTTVDVENILRGIQQTSERIANIELTMIKVDSSLDFLKAECGKKAQPPTRVKGQSISSIRQEMLKIKRYLRHLEHRVQCATTDDGKDGHGRLCPAERGGKMRFLNDKRKGDKTNSTGNPTSKLKTSERRSVQDDDKPTTQGWRQTGSKTTRRRQHSVYTCWGRSECPKWEGITTLYSGKVATLHSRTNSRVSSEYLCIPHRLGFNNHRVINSGLSLSPVKFGANITIFSYIGPEQCKRWGKPCEFWKRTRPELFVNLDHFQVPCSVCMREKRTATLVMPARNTCLPGWWKEYYGYLITHHSGEGAHHICVNADATGVPGSNNTGTQGPQLQPVAYKCDGPSCPSTSDGSSNREKALSCAVCTI